MFKILRTIGLPLLITAMLSGLSAEGWAAPAKLTAKIDSTTLVQGSKARITLSVIGSRQGSEIFPPLKPKTEIADGLEISAVKADTIPIDASSMTIDYSVDVQAFNPGNVPIAPFAYVFQGDTSYSNPLLLKVLEVDLDTLTTINPMTGTEAYESRWYDWIPDWWIWVVLGLAIVGLGICLYFFLRKDKVIVIKKVKKTIPPYELAMSRLAALQSKNFTAPGSERQYYTELTEILRQYLEGRFGINAMEMTSTQIISTLRRNEETRPGTPLVQDVLKVADFVKFAKVRPLPDDNIKAFNAAKKFVEDTKPLPPPPPGQNKNDKVPSPPAAPVSK